MTHYHLSWTRHPQAETWIGEYVGPVRSERDRQAASRTYCIQRVGERYELTHSDPATDFGFVPTISEHFSTPDFAKTHAHVHLNRILPKIRLRFVGRTRNGQHLMWEAWTEITRGKIYGRRTEEFYAQMMG